VAVYNFLLQINPIWLFSPDGPDILAVPTFRDEEIKERAGTILTDKNQATRSKFLNYRLFINI